MEIKSELNKVNDKIINATYLGTLIFFSIAFVPSVLRVKSVGFQPVFFSQIFVLITFIPLFIFRKRIALNIKTHALFALFVIIALGGIINFKLVSAPFFIFSPIIISTIMFGKKVSYIYSFLFLTLFMIIAFLHLENIIKINVDFNKFTNNILTWFTIVASYVFIIMVVTISTDKFHQFFIRSIKTVKQKSDELSVSYEKLKVTEERYRAIFEGSYDGYVMVNEQFQVYDCNSSYCKLVGYEFDELVGMDYKTLMFNKDKDWDSFLISIARTPKSEKSGVEVDIIHKCGEIIPAEVIPYITKNEETTYLWAVVRDLREKKELERKVFSTMVQSEENERARYAKELHDGLGPLLSTSLIYLHTLRKKEKDEKLLEYIDRTEGLTREAVGSIKEISNNLSPEILSKYGLVQAVRSFIEKLKLVTHVDFDIETNLDSKLEETIEFTVYRTIIELINNTIKYAQASKVSIAFKQSENELAINYCDNGMGFDYEKIKKNSTGFGLLNLENRIKKIGGTYIYKTGCKQGVKVTITVNINHT